MNNINVAIAGTGFMGAVHIEALKRLCLPIKGVLGSTPEKSQAAAAPVEFADRLSILPRTACRFGRASRSFGSAEPLAL